MAIIYKGTNLITGKSYIGQTKMTLEWRLYNNWCGHITRARLGDHKHICGTIAKYGETNFVWEVLETIDATNLTNKELRKKLNEREMHWIEYFDTFNHGYNQTKGGSNWGNSNVKGRIHVYKENEDYRMIKPEQLEEFLANGYIKGTGHSHHRYLTEEEKYLRRQKMIEKGTLDKLRDVSKAAAANNGSKILYKNGAKKVFKKEEVDSAKINGWLPYKEYLENGGTLTWVNDSKPSQVHKAKFALLYKNGKQKRIKPENYEAALADGWLPYKEYLASGGELSWRFPKRGKRNENKEN